MKKIILLLLTSQCFSMQEEYRFELPYYDGGVLSSEDYALLKQNFITDAEIWHESCSEAWYVENICKSIDWFLHNNFDINVVDNHKESLIHKMWRSAYMYSDERFKAVINKTSTQTLNLKNNNGQTPLMLCIKKTKKVLNPSEDIDNEFANTCIQNIAALINKGTIIDVETNDALNELLVYDIYRTKNYRKYQKYISLLFDTAFVAHKLINRSLYQKINVEIDYLEIVLKNAEDKSKKEIYKNTIKFCEGLLRKAYFHDKQRLQSAKSYNYLQILPK